MYYKTENEISTMVNTFIERTMDVNFGIIKRI